MFPYHFRSCAELTLHSDQVIAVEKEISPQMTNNFALLFPNPTKGEIFIQFTNPEKLSTCDVFVLNSLGQLIRQQNINHNSHLDISDLPTGYYVVRLQSGLFSQTFKIVKL